MINKTSVEYDGVIRVCRELFLKKSTDYGTAWRILRISSITDQIFIKDDRTELPVDEVEMYFDKKINETKELMFAKNHDYGEAWRDMRISSLTDLILMKILRVKQIEDNLGHTLASEGVRANYQDMLNYASFALIKLGLHKDS